MVQAAFEEAQDTLNDDPDYRPMSGLAVAGLLLGVCSVAAFFTSVLWSVAALAIAINVAALHHIRSTVPPRAGKRAALVGLALSLFCLVGALSYDACYHWLLQRQASLVVERYLSALLNNEFQVAHHLSLSPDRRARQGDQLDQAYQNDGLLAGELDEFKDSAALKRLLELEDPEVVLQGASAPEFERGEQRMIYVYRVRGKKKTARAGNQATQLDSFLLRFDLVRPVTLAHSIAGWQVRGLRTVDEKKAPE